MERIVGIYDLSKLALYLEDFAPTCAWLTWQQNIFLRWRIWVWCDKVGEDTVIALIRGIGTYDSDGTRNGDSYWNMVQAALACEYPDGEKHGERETPSGEEGETPA